MDSQCRVFVEIFGENQDVLPDSFIHECKICVFGYGSILWNAGFAYTSKRKGFVCGFLRRFWQGNVTHRGTTEKPGRCATLVPSDLSEEVWGVAYEVKGHDLVKAAWNSLFSRECKSGGYTVEVTSFYPAECNCPPEKVLIFRATPACALYSGESEEKDIAEKMFDCKGPAGYNIEYVLLLYRYLEKYLPRGVDAHLALIKHSFEYIAAKRGVCLEGFVKAQIPTSQVFAVCEKCSKEC